MKKKILVGATASTNYGDNVICETFRGLLQKYTGERFELVHVEYTPWMLRIILKILKVYSFFTKKHYDELIYKLRRHFLGKKLRKENSDVIFVGGQMFFDYFARYVRLFVESSVIANTKVYFYACGVGRLSNINKEHLRQVLNKDNVGLLSVRDNLDSIKELNPEVVFKPDVAICCNLIFDDIKKSSKEDNLVGLGVISISFYNKNNKGNEISEEAYISSMCNMIENIHILGFKVELFCNGEKGDYEVAVKIAQRFSEKVVVSERPTNARELIKQITKYNYVIASRLHALIISYSYNIPFFGMGWDAKVKEFFDLIGHSERYVDLSMLNDVDWRMSLQELSQGIKLERREELREEVLNTLKKISEF